MSTPGHGAVPNGAGPDGVASDGGGAAAAASAAAEATSASSTRRAPASAYELHAPTRFELGLYRFVRGALVGFAKLWFRLRVDGRPEVPAEGPFILSPVHRSNIDFLLVVACTKRRMRYLGKDTLWKPGVGRLWTALGAIPVHRASADREAMKRLVEVIESGEPVVIFPEGARQHGPEVQELFDGAAFVQSRTGVPIVPVGIGGSEAAMPKGAKWIKPRSITVEIGPLLPPPEAEGSKARRSAIRAQTAALKVELQRLFDSAQRRAGTPNR